MLEQYSPAIVPTLAREAALAREDEEYLESAAIDLCASLVLRTESGVEIDAAALKTLPAALASRVVRQALAAVAAGRFVGFQHIERVRELVEAEHAAGVEAALPGQVATRRGNRILLGSRPQRPFSNFFRFPLSIPGEVALAGWAVSAERVDEAAALAPQRARAAEVAVAAAPLRCPLAVRNRRPGDRFKPLGMGGRGRKLQDFLVDRKVARAERDRLPLVVDRDDTIVWVVGQSVAEDFRVTEPSQAVILLKARRLGGVG
jgi:tRNA(Ile)-lysidine synthase